VTVEIIQDDCLTEMPKIDANSIDSIVTDPPYGLEFMGVGWDTLRVDGKARVKTDFDVLHSKEHPRKASEQAAIRHKKNVSAQDWHYAWAVEALRVAKPGAHLLAFGGTRTFHRLACAIEDAGWEIRDCIMWVYGSGFPKSHNLSGDWQGWGTALKPAWEPIILARKPIEGTVAENVLKYGTGGINVDGCRVGGPPSSGGSISGRTALGQGSGWNAHENRTTEIDRSMSQGRWPANLIHDGSEEVMGMFPESKSTGGINEGKLGKRIYGKFKNEIIGTNAGGLGDSGSAARFFYCAKASKADRDEGCEKMEGRQSSSMPGRRDADDMSEFKTDNDVTARFTTNRRNHHPTVKPTSLMSYLCKLVTPPRGTVFDPFMGSGSTGKAAILEGFNFIGIEISAEYIEIARARIACAEKQESEKQEELF
jgi:DNA modification methylase